MKQTLIYRLAGFCMVLLLSLNARAQEPASVKGQVNDTADFKPVAFTSVSLVRKDSVLKAFMFTNDQGFFSFTSIPADTYSLLITRPGFADYEDRVILEAGMQKDLGLIPLISKTTLLKEFIVKEKREAIRIKGDTTEYFVDSFLVNKNSNVEDLLKKLPGIQVDRSGKITAQGQEVKKVLVDGEEFFGNDPTVATKNLKAENVEAVQVYDKKSDESALTGVDDGTKEKTINLKLKEDAKKGYFGKASAGVGTRSRYEYDAMFNTFKNKRKFSVFGAASNTNKTSLNWQDEEKYTGGSSNVEVDENTGAVYSYSYYDEDNGFDGVGIPETRYAGAHYSNKYQGDTHAVALNYNHKEMRVNGTDQNYTKYILPDTLYYNNQFNQIRNFKSNNNLSGKYEWKIDSLTTAKLSFAAKKGNSDMQSVYNSENLNEDAMLVNSNSRVNTNKTESEALNSNLAVYHKFAKKGRSLTLKLGQDHTLKSGDGFLRSTTNFYDVLGNIARSDVADQKKTTNTRTDIYNGSLSYTEPLSKLWFIVTDYSIKGTLNTSSRFTNALQNNEYTLFVDSLSSDFRYDILENKGGLTMRYVNKKLNYSFGGRMSYTDLKQDNLISNTRMNQYFFNLFPAANITYKIRNTTSASLGYNGNTRQPTLQQIQPLQDNTNPLDLFIGNQNLKQSFTNRFTLSYNSYKPIKGSGMYAYASYSFTDDDFTSFDDVDAEGRRTHQTVNIDGNEYLYGYAYHYFSFKKLGMYINQNIDFTRSINHNFLNGLKNVNRTQEVGYGLSFSWDKEELYSFSLGGKWDYTRNTTSLRGDEVTQFWISRYFVNAEWIFPKKFSIETNCEFNIRQRTSDLDRNLNTVIWDAAVSKKFFKNDNLECSIGVRDLLNQNLGFSRVANSNYINERTYTVLKRYFMVSVIWNFSKGGATGGGE